MFHPKTTITLPDGKEVQAIAPVVISASRATDIPAFYAEWFMHRLYTGYCVWRNPYNNQPQYISFKNLKVIVFWTKNPAPLIPYLAEIDRMGIKYYFQYTLNDYVEENYEPGLPPLEDRVSTFIQLSDLIGREKVIWRFDPLIITSPHFNGEAKLVPEKDVQYGTLTVDTLGNRIYKLGKDLHGKTNKLVFSFVDIDEYSKLADLKASYKMIPFGSGNMLKMAEHFQKLKQIWYDEYAWKVDIATCGEKFDLDKYGISHNRCIDPDLIVKLFGEDKELYNYIRHGKLTSEDLDSKPELDGDKVKDKGQRLACGCMLSKDIGSYNTCGHFCRYCYANKYADMESTKKNMSNHNPYGESIINVSASYAT